MKISTTKKLIASRLACLGAALMSATVLVVTANSAQARGHHYSHRLAYVGRNVQALSASRAPSASQKGGIDSGHKTLVVTPIKLFTSVR